MNLQEMIRELAEYAASLKGAELVWDSAPDDEAAMFHVELPGTAWGEFVKVRVGEDSQSESTDPFVVFPVMAGRLNELRAKYPMICETGWMPRDGHIQMAAPLDGSLPLAFLKSLVDEGYALVWAKLGEYPKFLIEKSVGPLDDRKLRAELAERYGLYSRLREIDDIARPAVLLLTKAAKEGEIPLGASKIGGLPDLPASASWPTYLDGKPLAFLCQVDLGEIAKLGTILDGLPASGLLSLFSVWGWVTEDDLDPRTPSQGWEDQAGWTVVLWSAADAKLERKQAPPRVNLFRAAAVEPVLAMSLPNHQVEPALSTRQWSSAEYGRFDPMQSDLRQIQLEYWRKKKNASSVTHWLGGYALFQQEFPETLLEMESTMLLQIGTDKSTNMCWGDGGELTFYADSQALCAGRFEKVWGTCQGG